MSDINNQYKGLKNMREDIADLQKLLSNLNSFGFEFDSSDQLTKELSDLDQIGRDIVQTRIKFIEVFNEKAWIATNSMKLEVLKKTVETYEREDIEHAERVLVEYYTNKDSLKKIQSSLKGLYIKYAREWSHLIEEAFEYHINKEYTASIPLFLMIIDGVMAKYHKNYGFFSNKIDLSVKESFLIGQIIIVKDICYSSRRKINEEEIKIPYRNGILHGKDLNYSNEYVSSKTINLFTSILDWIDDKANESKKIESLKKREEIKTTSIIEIAKDININKYNRKYLNRWKPNNNIIFKKDSEDIDKKNDIFPMSGSPEDYKKYSYIKTLVKFLVYWKEGNYGCLAKLIKPNTRFKKEYKDENNNPGLIREVFQNYKLKEYNIIKLNDHAVALKKVSVELKIETPDKFNYLINLDKEKTLVEFRVFTKKNKENIKLDEEINQASWILDSDFFYRMI